MGVSATRPQILFTSTGSNGIYRSINAGLTWAPINNGLGAVRARGLQIFTAAQGAHLYAATENGLWEALRRELGRPAAAAGGTRSPRTACTSHRARTT